MLKRLVAWKVGKAAVGMAVCLPICLGLPSAGNAQTAMTAGVVMEKMPALERLAFVAGIVEGLAYARYAKDGKKTEGMGCVYRWFYDKKDRIDDIYQAFNRFKEHLPGAVVAAMVAKECGN